MLQIISLTLPVFISGLVLIFVLKKNYLKFLNIPLDHRLKINGVRLFGDNKTYRGVVVFAIISISICATLQVLYLNGYHKIIHPLFISNPILIGLIYAFAYTFGELVNSVSKRQAHISPGKTTRSRLHNLQKAVDLADGIIMVAAILTIFTLVTAYQALAASVLGVGIHLGTDSLMQKLKLKQDFL